MALSKDVVIRLLGDASSAVAAQKAAADAAEVSVSAYRKAERMQTQAAASAEANAKRQHAAYDSVGRGMMLTGAVMAAGLGLATKAAIDWESAWAGVTKTVDGSPAQMASLEGELRKLATTLPATHEEIAGVAEAAGQLGIARGDIVEFTKVAIAMGVSTNLSAEEAATSLARMSNIMGTSSKDVDRMGSTLVALGNAGASTEGEILDMSLRIASAGRQAGMSEADVMGFANALSSLGMNAEAGGTALTQIIKNIGNAVDDGGDKLDKYAKIAGMSASEFSRAWKDDAAGAMTAVVTGLGKMSAEGQNTNKVLDELGLGSVYVSDAMGRLMGDADGLAASIATGNEAWAENSALMNEANQRYDTAASKIAIARNQITDAAIDIGGMLMPVLAGGATLVADLARGFEMLPGPVKDIVGTIGALAAVVGLVGGAALIAVPKLIAFRATMATISESSSGAIAGVGKFGTFMAGPWGAAIGIGVTLLGGLITALGATSQQTEESKGFTEELADALRDQAGATAEVIEATARKKAEDSGILKASRDAGVAAGDVTKALLGNRDAYDRTGEALDRYIKANTTTMMSENGPITTLNAKGQAAQAAREKLDGLSGSMGEAVVSNQRLAEEQKATAGATEVAGVAAEGTKTTMDDLRVAQEGVAESGGQAKTAAELLADALDQLNGPTLNLRDATRKYQEQIDDIAKAMGEEGWVKTLDINTEAGRKNQQMLDDLAKSGSEQAQAVLNTTGSYDAFKASLDTSRAELMKTAIGMGMTDDAALALANQILGIPDVAEVDIKLPTYAQISGQLTDVYNKVKGLPPNTTLNVGVLSQAAIDALRNIGFKVDTLPDGTVNVTADTSNAYVALNRFLAVRAVKTVVMNLIPGGSALGGPVPIGLASGGRVTGPGGPREDLVPAIGKNGTPYRLSDGEWIMQASAVNKYGTGFMAAVNAGRFATGGGIGTRVGGPSSTVEIDYDRLAAAVSGGSRGGVNIGTIVTQRNETGRELAEHLAFTMRTA